MRLTKEVRKQLLAHNEGFTTQTQYSARNFSESRTYTIKNGELRVAAHGKTSWADSRYATEEVADDETTHRFLRKHLSDLNVADLDPGKPEPAAVATASKQVSPRHEVNGSPSGGRTPHRGSKRKGAREQQATEAEASSSEDELVEYDDYEDYEDDTDDDDVDSSAIVGFIIAVVVVVVGVVLFLFAKPVWKNKVKPYLDRRRELRRERKAARALKRSLKG